MAAARKVVELPIGERELAELRSIARSRTEPSSRVERARILLHYRDDPSCYAVGRAVGVTHQTVQRCLARASRFGVMAALDDSPRPGKEPEITVEARAWLVSLACRKAKDVGYPHELWTTRLLARHSREHGPAAGHASLARIAQDTVCKLLAEPEVKPHKVRYYLERRDPEFEAKMAEVLCVYQEVSILRAAQANAPQVAPKAEAAVVAQTAPNVAFVCYDEKPGIQAIANTAPDLPPVAGKHACVARDHEYQRHGTLSLLAGIDLLTGQVHASVENRHRSREFIGFLKKLDAAYPSDTAIKIILDNHSAHVSKETNKWLGEQRDGRFSFVFTPKHGSWLNLVEGFFSKMARSVLRRIRVASKAELKQRVLAYLDDINREPVVHTWSYKITLPA
ncbi:MAG: IS630 family transposase [Pseudolabrys sp.]